MSIVEQKNIEWYHSLPRMEFGDVKQIEALPEYSATNPTGVKVGKMWRRHHGSFDTHFLRQGGIPKWVVCRYEEAPDGYVMTNWLFTSEGIPKPISELNADENARSHRLYYRTKMCKTVIYRPVIRKGMVGYHGYLPEDPSSRKAFLRAEGYRVPA